MSLKCMSIYRWGIVLLGIIFLLSCAAPSASVSVSGTGGLYKRIAVLPFSKANPEDTIDQLIPRSIAGQKDLTAESAENVVESLFLAKLGESKNIEIIPVEQVESVCRQITRECISVKETNLIQKLGNELRADAILVGYVYRYQERVGTPYGVEKPASVAFELQLIDVQEGSRRWKATFDKTQRSLTENLFNFRSFVKGKGRWLTVRELAEEGVEQIMQSFPGAR
jgi:hypothetical protein